jgi:hypothetical protein
MDTYENKISEDQYHYGHMELLRMIEFGENMDKVDPENLRKMHDDLAFHAARLASAQKKLNAAIIAKSGIDITQPGTHKNDWCKITVGKNVAWDQDELDRVTTHIREQWGSNPADYINTKMTVSETAYNAWPTEIRELFEPARTVKPGSPKVEFVEVNG